MAFLQHMTDKALPFFFNINQNVGKNSPNLSEDVALVSFMLANVLKASNDAGLMQLAQQATIGVYNPAMQAMIDAYQKFYKASFPSAMLDGHISRARPNIVYNRGGATFLIVNINYGFAKKNSNEWPRLDKVAACPAEVKQMITREILVD